MAKRRSDAEIQQAVAEYVGGLTLDEVARMFRVNSTTASGWINAAGVIRKKGSTRAMREMAQKKAEALDDLTNSGDSLTVVAKRHTIPRSTLMRWSLDHEADDIAYKGEWVMVGGILRGTARDVA